MRATPAAWLVLAPLILSAAAGARPGAPARFCDVYGGDSAFCRGQLPQCILCHTSTGYSPSWNAYGLAMFDGLTAGGYYDEAPSDERFNDYIAAAIQYVDGAGPVDHDSDGVLTAEEIALGTNPGDVQDVFVPNPAPQGASNPDFAIGSYDLNQAYQRTSIVFCGASATYDERQTFRALDDVAQYDALHAKLEACMRSDYWRNQALPSLADNKIRPVPRFEQWRWDYRLWRYANLPPCDDGDTTCGDNLPRSARDLVTGTYHVRELEEGQLIQVDGRNDGNAPACTTKNPNQWECGFDAQCVCPGPGFNCDAPGVCIPVGGWQVLPPERRAGMISTSWWFFFFTMFSDMPRTTAAQALRAYFGTSIELQEGLLHVAGEPRDVDNKNVDGIGCRECHMHLDPAAYAFVKYRGIGDGGATGSFDPARPIDHGLWASPAEEPTAYFFEQPITDTDNPLVQWANIGVQSDYFKRNHALTFFTWAVGREPRPDEEVEFELLYQSMDDDNYETPALLHRLIDTDAFGCL